MGQRCSTTKGTHTLGGDGKSNHLGGDGKSNHLGGDGKSNHHLESEETKDEIFDKVKLNVGGRMFITSKATLLRIPDTYFQGLLSSNWKPDENNVYAIDRDSSVFDLILQYMRFGDPSIFNNLKYSQMNLLKQELDYYLISLPPWQFDFNRSSSSATYSQNNMTVKIKNTPEHTWGCVIGTKPVERFTVKILNHVWFHIGFMKDEKKFKECLVANDLLTNQWGGKYYTLYNGDGELYSNSKGDVNKDWNPKAAKFVTGDFVTFLKVENKIRIERNKIDLGVAFTNVKKGALYPFFTNGRGSPSFTIIV